MTFTRRFILAGATALATALPAAAQELPGNVRLVIGSTSTGGDTYQNSSIVADALAEKLGLEPAEVLEAVSGGAAGSFMLSDRGPRMLEGLDAQVASAVSIFVKDSGLVSEIAESVGMEAPLLEAAKKKYAEAADAGWAGRDDSQVIQTYRG